MNASAEPNPSNKNFPTATGPETADMGPTGPELPPRSPTEGSRETERTAESSVTLPVIDLSVVSATPPVRPAHRRNAVPFLERDGQSIVSMIRHGSAVILTVHDSQANRDISYVSSVKGWRSFPQLEKQDGPTSSRLSDFFAAVNHFRSAHGELPPSLSATYSRMDGLGRSKPSFVSLEKSGDRYLMTVSEPPNWIGRRFGLHERKLQFVGRTNIWRSYPSYERVDSNLARTLGAFFEAATRPR